MNRLDARLLRALQTCEPMTAAELQAEIATSRRLGLLDWSATLDEVEAALGRLREAGAVQVTDEGLAEYVPRRSEGARQRALF